MSLREDLDTMDRHQRAGTLRDWFLGTAEPIPEPKPLDASANERATYAWLRERGE